MESNASMPALLRSIFHKAQPKSHEKVAGSVMIVVYSSFYTFVLLVSSLRIQLRLQSCFITTVIPVCPG